MNEIDVIIVGQGIAGSFLAEQLEQLGQSVLIVDKHDPKSASNISSGMYNAVVLKRFSPILYAQQQTTIAQTMIKNLEDRYQTSLHEIFPIYRILHDKREQGVWTKKAQTDELAPFLEAELKKEAPENIVAPFGLGEVKQGGRFYLQKYLNLARTRFFAEGKLIDETFAYEELQQQDQKYSYKGWVAKRIIFCEGFGMKNNPYFNYLPLEGNKGEVLHIQTDQFNERAVYKSKAFLVPLDNSHTYLLGATYNWEDKDYNTSLAAQSELLEKSKTFLRDDCKVIDHKAGMRPTVVDRRPLLGEHPRYSHMYVVNGLGTRGILNASFTTQQMVAYLQSNATLDQAYDIKRFEHYFK